MRWSAPSFSSHKYAGVLLALLVHLLLCLLLIDFVQLAHYLPLSVLSQRPVQQLSSEPKQRNARLQQHGGIAQTILRTETAPVIFQQLDERPPQPTKPPPEPPQKSTPPATAQTPQPRVSQRATPTTPPSKASKQPVKQEQSHQQLLKKIVMKHTPINQPKKEESTHDKQLTFSDILNGFSTMLKKGNNAWASRDGDKRKEPDFQDLKMMTYMQKIGQQLRTTWNMGLNQEIQQLVTRASSNFTFQLSLGKEGQIVDISVVLSSGLPELDRALVAMIRENSPFAPIPNHLHMQVVTLRYELRWM